MLYHIPSFSSLIIIASNIFWFVGLLKLQEQKELTSIGKGIPNARSSSIFISSSFHLISRGA
jgi:hypothetical protein